MPNMKCALGFIICLFFGLFLGFKASDASKMDPQIYHANTVGSQIAQINGIYKDFSRYNPSVLQDAIKYNKDMLTVIDCGQLLKSVAGVKNDPYLWPFRDGLNLAWAFLLENGIDRSDVTLCNGDVFEWIDGRWNQNCLNSVVDRTVPLQKNGIISSFFIWLAGCAPGDLTDLGGYNDYLKMDHLRTTMLRTNRDGATT